MIDLRCTYRLQLGPDLGFRGARALVPYLRELGVSHLYLSPSLQAREGSTHGYDVVDPTRLSESLGGEEEFQALCSSGRRAGLGVVLDIVPNHMAATDESPFWRDPLWRARFYDLDWRTGAHRRFFDVGELAGVRMEDPEVWEVTHSKVVELVREGLVDGVRIDHPDGLANPRRYLERLGEAGIERVWVEKILEPGERLRADWPVQGTTGYEFLNDVTALFVDPAGEEPLTRLYEDVTGERRSFAEVAAEAKLEQAETTFDAEAAQLAAKLTFDADLPRALASLHVYRTYVEPETGRVAAEDRAAVAAAGLPEELARILLLEERGHDSFVTRFQQTTPPVHAKGVEDTAFYRWNRFVALNEVGGDPARLSLSVEAFHEANLARPPGGLLATTTHDTKRSGDVRARLACIAADPDEWAALVRPRVGRWRDPNEAYLILQTLVGAWPLSSERLQRYLEKALREAKVSTSWLEPDERWEAGAKRFGVSLLADTELGAYAERLAARAERVVLGTTLLKLTAPGVPDLYGGDELPFLALVDPDNRRPVDWEARRRALAGPDPPAKLDLIRRTLALRARRPRAFAGGYEPLDGGPDTCAFTRAGEVLVAVAVRGDLREPRPAGTWRDVVRTPTLLLAERL
ncbi:MAG TPA: alpha-amylase family glycosyl hydrolase [Gaiellaceae bacterium]|nr:alpha-amylase family glycosyl hydrolase [Gaiellaceae bacterium]